MISFSQFFENWNNASTTSLVKKGVWKHFLFDPKKPFYQFQKLKRRIKYKFLYRMYCQTNDMKMCAFRRCVYYFMEAGDFKNWKERFHWIGENFSRKEITEIKMKMYYGEKEGQKRWEQYRQKQAYSNSFEYKNVKYGMSKEEFSAYNKSRSVTLENMIMRHGEVRGKLLFLEYRQRQRDAGCSLAYFIKKYGSDGERIYQEVCAKKAQTLENYIRKYGEQGKEIYQEYINSRCSHSKIADELFSDIMSRLPELEIECVLSGKEHMITDKHGICYFLDLYIPKLSFCIEFNGDFWHGNPRFYTADHVMFKNPLITCGMIWEKDARKRDAMRKMGIDYLTIWEDDFRANKEIVIEKCCDEIRIRFSKYR